VNQHERVEQQIAEHDEQAQKARNVAAALSELERIVGMLAEHVDCGSFNARYDLTNALVSLRCAVRNVERDL